MPKVGEGGKDHVDGEGFHAAVVDGALLELARTAGDFDAQDFFAGRIGFSPARIGGAKERDGGDVEGGGKVARTGVVADHKAGAADDFLERAQGDAAVVVEFGQRVQTSDAAAVGAEKAVGEYGIDDGKFRGRTGEEDVDVEIPHASLSISRSAI